jgi:hypothetical protein
METVVEENPLSLATSRMVTIEAFSLVLSPRSSPAAKAAAKTAALKPKRESPIPPQISTHPRT